jgi:DNA-binding GntR family transcriptional regulator
MTAPTTAADARPIDIAIDRQSPVPLYHQVSEQLRAMIAGGQLEKGQFLTNELDLADHWRLSRPTVRRAIQELVDSGLLVRRRGVGTQVVNDQVRRPVRLSSLWDDLASQGRAPTTEVLALKRVRARGTIAEALEIPDNTEVIHLERRRNAERNPLAIMRNWLRTDVADHLTEENLATYGLYTLLRQVGVRPHSASQRIGAAAANSVNARLLDLPVGAPLVTMRRVMQDDRGRVVELGEHAYDARQYTVEMTVVENP